MPNKFVTLTFYYYFDIIQSKKGDIKVKCTINIEKDREEEVIIFAHSKTELVNEIEALVQSATVEILGYNKQTIVKLNPNDIFCFNIEENKIVAYLKNEKYYLKQRLYEIENILNKNFVKINQSCIVNIKMIEKFEASFVGALLVILKNGFKDYVSRRQLKEVKERLGL